MTGKTPNILPSESTSKTASPTVGVVIATRGRPQAIFDCLHTVNGQTSLPAHVIVVDSSSDTATQKVIEKLQGELHFPCSYYYSNLASAAQQRNMGAQLSDGEILLFLDDDVVLDPDCIAEILHVFASHDYDRRLGGVSGTISNQTYSDPKGLNRFLLGLCLGTLRGSFAGRVLGPAVNFLPVDGESLVQETEWLPTTCVAYRRSVFLANRFEETFDGYSFAEDVHLSTRVALKHRLMNTTRARVFHSDLGKDTHRDWVALGESQVRNRGLIMTSVLRRNRLIDHLRLFAFEMIYMPVTWLAGGLGTERLKRLASLLRGKLSGFVKMWASGGSPNAPSTTPTTLIPRS